jgi:L-aspartate oxidase
MHRVKTDFLVIGSGIAGLATALELSALGEVMVLSKDRPDVCNSVLAQGGIAAAVGVGDSPHLHSDDTVKAGAGIADADVVDIVTSNAPEVIDSLIMIGTNFDKTPEGGLALGMEGAHCRPRILHHGDQTGAEIWRALYTKAQMTRQIKLTTGAEALELIVCHGECHGALVHFAGESYPIFCRAVVLATGGYGNLYGYTTNARFSNGDGMALAWRAGAELADMEFVQFHPTALNVGVPPFFLISEAVRGEGAVLVNENGEKFMGGVHPQADLAPRDVVSRAIVAQQGAGHQVFLDARCIGKHFITRFPRITQELFLRGIDPETALIPVTPAAHFAIGGVATDTFGRSSIPGLYACGETASTGVHGANRLASNSLLEGLVFGRRLFQAVSQQGGEVPLECTQMELLQKKRIAAKLGFEPIPLADDDSRLTRLQEIMWGKAGIIRSGPEMAKAKVELEHLLSEAGPQELQLQNIIQVGMLIVEAALLREESRGSHYRTDFPETANLGRLVRSRHNQTFGEEE